MMMTMSTMTNGTSSRRIKLRLAASALPALLMMTAMMLSLNTSFFVVARAAELDIGSSSSSSSSNLDLNGGDPIEFDTLQSLVIDGFVDTESCYDALESAIVVSRSGGLLGADVRKMNQAAYAAFIKSYGPDGFLEDVTAFNALPLILKSNFNILACLCQSDPNDDSCCVGDKAGIDTDGSFDGEAPTPTQQSYLFLVCSLTSITIERVMESSPPSAAPSISPAPTEAPTITVSPTVSPTPGPTQPPATVNITYAIGVRGGPSSTNATIDDYENELISAMDSLAPEVLLEVTLDDLEDGLDGAEARSNEEDVGVRRLMNNDRYRQTFLRSRSASASSSKPSFPSSVRKNNGDQRRQLRHHQQQERQRRRLRSVQLPTSVVEVSDIECPSSGTTSEDDRCESVTASVTLIFQPTDQDPDAVALAFTDEMNRAIAEGRLQGLLDSPDVYILGGSSGAMETSANDSGDSETISSGGVAGIVVGSLAVVAVAAYFAVGRRGEPKEELEQLQPAPRDVELDQDGGDDNNGDDDPATVKVSSVAVKAKGTLSPSKAKVVEDTEPDEKGADDMSNAGGDESSNAGSSGWSSSAGLSSIHTGSHDDGLDPFEKPSIGEKASPGAIASALQLLEGGADPDSPEAANEPEVTRSDLDNAIEAGDWAAVGATAALLAAASDSQSYTSHSANMSGTRSQSGSSVSSLDAARAAELDHLVDAGDWEGVVLAAAKYEADEGDTNASRSQVSSEAAESRSVTDTAGQTADSSVGSSRALKQQEYRTIVEDLVRRVVPEEIQNVDEMMLQFRGREDELVETLRTMQERAVAQKARHSSQRAAKHEAKMEAKKNKSLGTGQVTAHASAKSLGTGQLESPSTGKSLGTGTIVEESDSKAGAKSTLDDAIERGDWDAVGDAAAILAEADISSSVGSDEIDRLADGISTDGSSAADGQSSTAAAELEELIEAGDWTGIVQAASAQKDSGDQNNNGDGSAGGGGTTDNVEARRQRRMKHLQEEQNALAQAEIWTAIADGSLSGSEANRDQGAADAADWAISRSLNALVQAEQSGVLDPSEGTNSVGGNNEV
mmetsp:Transcript_29429/g.71015  ORF Transcript_29429/g.71015 Transcript_29429/m.71015 type:complete len:1070 (-) Transcript_29429:308-3517(-)